MKTERSCGILCHITSLPGNFGIGTLGKEAYEFADLLNEAGQRYWQVLPVGPVSTLGYSPYSSPSTFAGNYFFISLEKLAAEAWFKKRPGFEKFPESDLVDFEKVKNHTLKALKTACDDFFEAATPDKVSVYDAFCKDAAYWLDDYALFAALESHFNTASWIEWDGPIARREPAALESWRKKLAAEATFNKFVQFIFFTQWMEWKEYCNSKGIKIIGDIPIYISMDGADAWANPDILQLDEKTGTPSHVAGVPPDYFSQTGQRWGNPLFSWQDKNKKLSQKTLEWWVRRIRHLHRLMDIVRIDHFRGFESYWAIPAAEKTAVKGKWVRGPGLPFFRKLEEALGELPLIAEDLGIITPAVDKLRDDLGLPGMKILQFAFDQSNDNYYLPHNITNPNCVLYTGTHDNNTTNGWFYGKETDEGARKFIQEYLGSTNFNDFHWQLIRLAYMSVANVVIVPAQDVLGYGGEFRMNTPGTVGGNWTWKLRRGRITPDIVRKLRRMAHLYRRIPAEEKKDEKKEEMKEAAE